MSFMNVFSFSLIFFLSLPLSSEACRRSRISSSSAHIKAITQDISSLAKFSSYSVYKIEAIDLSNYKVWLKNSSGKTFIGTYVLEAKPSCNVEIKKKDFKKT
jgi:hypothetical protein